MEEMCFGYLLPGSAELCANQRENEICSSGERSGRFLEEKHAFVFSVVW